MKEGIISNLKMQLNFFLNTVECFSEDDSAFKPKDEMYTVAQHIGHTAETYDWFLGGAFGDGFKMDFDNYAEEVQKYTSFEKCVDELKSAVNRTIQAIDKRTEEELMQRITSEPMKGAPKMSIVYSLADHTAHHRGALSVYARLLGKAPKMPYGEM